MCIHSAQARRRRRSMRHSALPHALKDTLPSRPSRWGRREAGRLAMREGRPSRRVAPVGERLPDRLSELLLWLTDLLGSVAERCHTAHGALQWRQPPRHRTPALVQIEAVSVQRRESGLLHQGDRRPLSLHKRCVCGRALSLHKGRVCGALRERRFTNSIVALLIEPWRVRCAWSRSLRVQGGPRRAVGMSCWQGRPPTLVIRSLGTSPRQRLCIVSSACVASSAVAVLGTIWYDASSTLVAPRHGTEATAHGEDGHRGSHRPTEQHGSDSSVARGVGKCGPLRQRYVRPERLRWRRPWDQRNREWWGGKRGWGR